MIKILAEEQSSRKVLNRIAGLQIKELRIKLGFSQEELAGLLSDDGQAIYPKTLYLWETGKSKVPAWVLVKIQIIAQELSNEQSLQNFAHFNLLEINEVLNSILEKVRTLVKG